MVILRTGHHGAHVIKPADQEIVYEVVPVPTLHRSLVVLLVKETLLICKNVKSSTALVSKIVL